MLGGILSAGEEWKTLSADSLVVVYDLKLVECKDEQLLQRHRK